MQIWIDADACPGAIKAIIFRAAEREGVHVSLVANQTLRHPPSLWIRSIQVPRGFDVADHFIVDAVAPGDLVVTADIPLAAAVVDKQAFALNPRGEFYSSENVRELLDLRNFMETMRNSGVETGGPRAFGQADSRNFAGRLDRFLTQSSRTTRGGQQGVGDGA